MVDPTSRSGASSPVASPRRCPLTTAASIPSPPAEITPAAAHVAAPMQKGHIPGSSGAVAIVQPGPRLHASAVLPAERCEIEEAEDVALVLRAPRVGRVAVVDVATVAQEHAHPWKVAGVRRDRPAQLADVAEVVHGRAAARVERHLEGGGAGRVR